MRIYVAGRTKDYKRVREVQRMCESYDHTITFDWRQIPLQATKHPLGPQPVHPLLPPEPAA
jgi:hypothetical protein